MNQGRYSFSSTNQESKSIHMIRYLKNMSEGYVTCLRAKFADYLLL